MAKKHSTTTAARKSAPGIAQLQRELDKKIHAVATRKAGGARVTEALRAKIVITVIKALAGGERDMLSQTEEMREAAALLKVPYVLVLIAADSTMSEENRNLTDEDIFNYLSWCADHNIAAGQPIDEKEG